MKKTIFLPRSLIFTLPLFFGFRLSSFGLLFFTFSLSFFFTFTLSAQRPPNVIVVLADDIGLGDISYYRSMHTDQLVMTTPHIDEIATQGMAFTNAHSPAALCAPSRYAIMSGNSCFRSPFPWGVWGPYEKSPIGPDELTLGKVMKQAGYNTAFFGKWHLGGDYLRLDDPTTIYRGPRHKPELDVDISRMVGAGPMEKGFDYSITFPAGIQNVPYAVYENEKWMPLKEDSEIGYISQENMTKIGVKLDKSEGLGDLNWDPHQMGPLLVGKAVDYIRLKANKEKPFFMYYCSQAVHLPHTPPDQLNGTPIAGTTPSSHMDMIRELDVQMGMLVAELKAQGIYENTLFIFTSDNGGLLRRETLASGHQPSDIYRGGKNSCYEGGHRVPFIATWPEAIEGDRISDEPILGLDILATLAAITGKEIPSGQALDSRNLLPVLAGNNNEPVHPWILLQSGTGNEVIIIQEGWKLIMKEVKDENQDLLRTPLALFNLEENPTEDEAFNLIESKDHRSLVKELYHRYITERNGEVHGIEKEKKAIRAVIEEEMAAFYDQDLSRIAATWKDDPSTRKIMMTAEGIAETEGIEAILLDNKKALAREMGDHMEWESSYENYTIQVYGKTALAYHDSRHISNRPEAGMDSKMRRIIHLVKEDGRWKMDMMALYKIPENDTN